MGKKKELIEKIKAGVSAIKESENFLRWLKLQARFPKYSFGNTILIWLQKPEATKVAGFKTWQQMGRKIKKGERGIAIFAPIIVKELKDDSENEKVDELIFGEEPEKEGEALMGFKVTHVWDISQTVGQALPQICSDLSGKVEEIYLDALVKTGRSHNLTVEIVPAQNWLFGEAKGVLELKSSSISLREASSLQVFSVLVHELAHALDTRKEARREEREIAAEACSFIVCEHFGFDTSNFSFEYLACWSNQKELSGFSNSLELAQKIASYIISQMEKEINRKKEKKAA